MLEQCDQRAGLHPVCHFAEYHGSAPAHRSSIPQLYFQQRHDFDCRIYVLCSGRYRIEPGYSGTSCDRRFYGHHRQLAIEKITPALYATTGNPASDLLGNDVYQCVLQNSPTPITTSGQPIQLFTFRVPSDCMNGAIQVHTNNNSIRQALLNAFGININNQMSVSVNDAISTDIYKGNITNPALYNCPLDDVPDAVDDMVSVNEDNSILVNVTGNDDFGNNIPATGPIVITTPPAVAPRHRRTTTEHPTTRPTTRSTTCRPPTLTAQSR